MSRILPPPQSPRDDTRSHTSGAGMDRRRRQRGGRPSRLATSARAVPLPRPRFSRTRQGIRPSFARTQRYNRHERPLLFHGKSIGRRHLGADTPTIERRSHLCGRPRKHPAPGTKRTPRRTGEDITPRATTAVCTAPTVAPTVPTPSPRPPSTTHLHIMEKRSLRPTSWVKTKARSPWRLALI